MLIDREIFEVDDILNFFDNEDELDDTIKLALETL